MTLFAVHAHLKHSTLMAVFSYKHQCNSFFSGERGEGQDEVSSGMSFFFFCNWEVDRIIGHC